MLAIAAAAFAALAFSPAAAATGTQVRVAYADLDLDREAGAQVLLRRIDRASTQACAARSGPMPLTERIRARRCIRAETEEAVRDVGNATLTALYYRRARVVIAQQ
jgi:UrcA family protein